MNFWQILILVVLGFATGWFTYGSLQDAIDGIQSWKIRGRWAFAALFELVTVWYIFTHWFS